MNWTRWWVFVPAEAALCLTPGPAVLLVVSTALRLGWRKGVASILGILTANAIYYGISMTGLGAVLAASYRIFSLVKWIGVAYLVFLGCREIGSKHLPAAAHDSRGEAGFGGLFRQALFIQLSNPKAILFFAAFLPQFLDVRFPIAPQIMVLCLTGELIEFTVLLSYAVFAGAAGPVTRQERYVMWTNRIAGTLLIAAATGLALLG